MRRKPDWRHSHFVRLVLSYCLLAVLLVGAAGGYLYNRANAVMAEEMSKDSQTTLANIRDYLEQTLLRKYEDTFVTKAMTTVNPAGTDDLLVLLENDPANYMYKIRSLIDDMGIIASANEGLAGISIYIKRANYVMNESYYYHDAASSPDAAFVQTLGDVPPYRWIKRTKGGTGEQVLTYVYTLPYKFLHQYTLGYLYIDIRLDYLERTIRQMTGSVQGTLLLFDKDGTPIFEHQQGGASVMALVDGAIARGGSELGVAEDDAGRNMIAFMPADASRNGWSYVLVKPMSSFYLTTDKFKRDIIRCCLLIVLTGLLSAYVVSSRIYLPLKRLVLRIGEHYDNNGTLARGNGNEFNVIDSFLQYTDRKLIRLQDQVRGQNLLHLIHGNIGAIGDLAAVPVHVRYVPVHLRCADGAPEVLNDWVAALQPVVPFDSVGINSQEAALLFYPDPAEAGGDRAVFEQLLTHLGRCPAAPLLSIGIGEAVASMEDIHHAYAHAVYSCGYSFVYGYPAVIRYEDIRHRRPQHIAFAYETYFNGLLAGDRQLTETLIDGLAASLAEPTLLLESLEVNVMQFATSLSGFVIDRGLQELFPGASLFVEAKKTTLHETVLWMKGCGERIASYCAARASNGHQQLMLELKRYIDEHPEDDISLDWLAERAGMTPNYVSALFREALHLPFNEYVNKVRLEKAAALLLETSSSVSEIAERTGYRYAQYFIRKFKAKYGVTPTQYRQAFAPYGSGAAGSSEALS
ncbi:helix-turn-helix domain-containing protein [Paenibacillus cymbidii]|uniref:helix-turn-helix domain-containing protein n=1 Tax=Paenibacillus cymbidii TaxID=1639034 RepID=UPI00108054FF|nr:helix-turn-helix domain-containing protein [Paenibacillus cymbidii]